MICKNTKQKEIENLLLTSSHEKYGLAVLVPSFEKASKYTSYGAILANKGTPNMYSTVIDFVRASPDIVSSHRRNIVFANRYDGIDLPDESCRILIIDSLPYADNLADNYEELCRSNSDIAKIKIAQKIEQGLGRSVRGEKDYNVSSDRTGIHKSEAGQMDQHCGWFETEYPGHQYTSYLIIPTTHLDDDAYLTHNTKIISTSQLSLLKSNIEAFSLEFKDYDIAGLTPETVSSWLINHKLHSNFLEQYYSVSPN